MTKLYVISGHGAGDPGAGGNGYNEADVARLISSRMKALGGDAVVELDKNINWYASGRVDSALKKQVGNNPLLELHLDSSDSKSAHGGHIIIKSGTKPDGYDNALASFLSNYFPGRSEVIVKRGNLGNANRAYRLGINYRLIECCFITNANDMKKLMGNIDAFCKGVLNAFGLYKIKVEQGWVKNDTGWWYSNADGTWPRNKWLKLKGVWYFFNDLGYAETGWEKVKGYWYYFDANCKMQTGWKKLDGRWYYLNPKKDGSWPEGSARTGWIKCKSHWYYLNKKGEGTECAMRTGWYDYKGARYYLDPAREGIMACNESMKIDGKLYTFDKDGRMQTVS